MILLHSSNVLADPAKCFCGAIVAVAWSADVEGGLRGGGKDALAKTRANVVRMLAVLAREVLRGGVAQERRRKYVRYPGHRRVHDRTPLTIAVCGSSLPGTSS